MKKSIIIFLALCCALQIGFSCGFLTNIEDCWNDQDFEGNFAQDPEEGFLQDPTKAWNLISQNPQEYFKDDKMIEQAYNNNKQKFYELVLENKDLLQNPKVLELIGQEAELNIAILNSNPQLKKEFLAQYGIEDNGFNLAGFNQKTGEITIHNEVYGTLKIKIDDLAGGSINHQGSITLNTGLEIFSGEISRKNNEIEFKKGGIARIHDETFQSSGRFKISNTNQAFRFQTLSSQKIFFEGGTKNFKGSYIISQSQRLLGERSNLFFLSSEGQTTRSYRTIEATFLSNTQCTPGTNCIYEDGINFGISSANRNKIRVQFHTNEEINMQVSPITDSSTVEIKVPNDKGKFVRFKIDQNDISQFGGILGTSSNLNLNAHIYDPKTKKFLPLSGQKGTNGRLYSIYTGEEIPDFEGNRRCRIGQSCQIGSSTYVKNIYEVFCSSDNKCYNSYGLRVNKEGTHYITGEGIETRSLGEVGKFNGDINILEKSSQLGNVWLTPKVKNHKKTRGFSRDKIDESQIFEGEIPTYNIKSARCAKYMRLAGKDLFGVNFNRADAWDLHKNNPTAHTFTDVNKRSSNLNQNDFSSFSVQTQSAFKEGKIKQGDAMRFWYPRSNYRSNDVTHVALVLGTNSQGKVLIGHQFGSRFYRETVEEAILRTQMRPTDVLTTRRISNDQTQIGVYR